MSDGAGMSSIGITELVRECRRLGEGQTEERRLICRCGEVIGDLWAKLGRLPHTADGVPIVPGMMIYFPGKPDFPRMAVKSSEEFCRAYSTPDGAHAEANRRKDKDADLLVRLRVYEAEFLRTFDVHPKATEELGHTCALHRSGLTEEGLMVARHLDGKKASMKPGIFLRESFSDA